MRKYLIDYDRTLERQIVCLANSKVSDHNKELISKFYRYNVIRNLSKARIIRHFQSLRTTALFLNKDFEQATRQDYEKLFFEMQEKGYAAESVDTEKKILKVFHKWLSENETYPPCVSWFKTNSIKNKKLPEDLFIQEDIKQLIKSAYSKRDKAFISCLWESGARIGEIGGLQIKNVTMDEFGCKILVDGKTGMRRIRLVHSAPYLVEWINQHPNSKDPEAPLWVNFENRIGKQVTYENIKKMLKKTGKRAGIQKPINPHNFRHSRATYMAQFLMEAQMKEYFGWTQNSSMAARYVHLSGKQVDDAVLRMYGLKQQDKKEDILKRNSCPRCKNLNDINNEYCEKCWLPLTPNATIETNTIEQKSQESVISLMKLIELAGANPEKIKQVISFLQQDLTKDV